MKKFIYSISALATLTFIACSNQNKTSAVQDTVAIENAETNATCYMAVSNTDTAYLKINQKGKNVTGELKFDFSQKQKTNGQISGEFTGDTLFVDYNFKIDGNAFKNPQVFLKKDNKLYQGTGELEVYLGRTYFKKGVPLNFDKGFVFELHNCD